MRLRLTQTICDEKQRNNVRVRIVNDVTYDECSPLFCDFITTGILFVGE